MTLIGITGKKRAGKDTVAARLIEAHGFTRFAFADIMKEFAFRLDPLIPWGSTDTLHRNLDRLSDIVRVDGWEKAKENPEVRRLLQALGDDAGRTLFGENFWIDRTFAEIEDFYYGLGYHAPVVITDVRYPNEADAIRERGGIIVRVVRPGLESSDTHRSEVAMDGYAATHTIRNDDTVATLHSRVDRLMEV